MSPRPEQIKKGIQIIILDIGVNSTIFIHTPGLLSKFPYKQITFFGESVREFNDAPVGYKYNWRLNYEFHELKGKNKSMIYK